MVHPCRMHIFLSTTISGDFQYMLLLYISLMQGLLAVHILLLFSLVILSSFFFYLNTLLMPLLAAEASSNLWLTQMKCTQVCNLIFVFRIYSVYLMPMRVVWGNTKLMIDNTLHYLFFNILRSLRA